MEWYYSKDNERSGPVGPDELIALQHNGTISGNALVWREGQGDWKKFHEVAGEIFADVDGEKGDSETAVCAHSGNVMPKSQMVPYGDAWVAPEYKDAFVQRLMEGDKLKLSEAGEYALQYMGFWWRVLGAVIDYFVKIIPVLICQIPYFMASIAAGTTGKQIDVTDPNPLSVWTTAMIVTYLIAMVGQLGISIFYDTWMVGKYQATVGKMAIGAVVVNPDGSRVTYGRSFGRWAAKKLLNQMIVIILLMVPFVLIGVMAGAWGASGGGAENSEKIVGIVVMMFASLIVLGPLAMFPYWMCGMDAEKRSLHDRVCATRVVKKRAAE